MMLSDQEIRDRVDPVLVSTFGVPAIKQLLAEGVTFPNNGDGDYVCKDGVCAAEKLLRLSGRETGKAFPTTYEVLEVAFADRLNEDNWRWSSAWNQAADRVAALMQDNDSGMMQSESTVLYALEDDGYAL